MVIVGGRMRLEEGLPVMALRRAAVRRVVIQLEAVACQ